MEKILSELQKIQTKLKQYHFYQDLKNLELMNSNSHFSNQYMLEEKMQHFASSCFPRIVQISIKSILNFFAFY
jgi:hypothetical protein